MKVLKYIFLILLIAASAAAANFPTGAVPFVALINDPSLGTKVGYLASLNSSSPSQAVVSATGSTSGVIGITVAGAGTQNAALVQILGQVNCVFDNATTAKDYIVPSTITAGQCHDSGSAPPSTAPAGNVGQVISTNATAGTYTILLTVQTLASGGSSISTPVSIANGGTGTTYGPPAVFLSLVNSNTTAGALTKLTGAGAAVNASTADTDGMVGICTSGCGTTGNGIIQVDGIASCNFDAATTANDWVQISSSVAGDCHDAGAFRPSSGQTVGRVLSTNASAGSYQVVLNLNGPSGSGGAVPGGVTNNLQINNGSGGLAAYTGTSCTNQVITALDANGNRTCSNVTSAFVDTTIARTGGDLDTSNPTLVTGQHFSVPLPANKGGSGLAGTTPHGVIVGEGNGPFNPILLATDTLLAGLTGLDPIAVSIPNCSGQALTHTAGNVYACLSIASANYATIINTSGVLVNATCSASAGTHPSRDTVWQILTGNLTYNTPASGSCIDGDIIEFYFIQGDNHSYTVTVADGSGTTHLGTLYTVPTSTGTNQGYFLHALYQYHTNNTQWELLGQATNPATPNPVSSGGTSCGGPFTFANLPGSPTLGETCGITNASACTTGVAVTASATPGVFCQTAWNGTNWMPAGAAAAVSGPPTGAAGGDLTATYPNPNVASTHISGGTNTNLAAFNSTGNMVNYNGSSACPTSPHQFGVQVTNSGALNCLQPAFSDLSGVIGNSQIPQFNQAMDATTALNFYKGF